MKTELHEDYNSIETPIIGPKKSVFQNVMNMCKNAKKNIHHNLRQVISSCQWKLHLCL